LAAHSTGGPKSSGSTRQDSRPQASGAVQVKHQDPGTPTSNAPTRQSDPPTPPRAGSTNTPVSRQPRKNDAAELPPPRGDSPEPIGAPPAPDDPGPFRTRSSAGRRVTSTPHHRVRRERPARPGRTGPAAVSVYLTWKP
jgi:hypothetical protein